MKAVYTSYEHTKPGFPKVILKWTEENNVAQLPYVTVHGVIQRWSWEYGTDIMSANSQNYEKEMARFDKWVCQTFSEDATVQG